MGYPSIQETFLHGANATFIAEVYARYMDDPTSVDHSWADFFAEMNDEERDVLDELTGASWAPKENTIVSTAPLAAQEDPTLPQIGEAAPQAGFAFPAGMVVAGQNAGADQIRRATLDSIRALMLIRAYRARGHLMANLDPLGLEPPTPHPELEPSSYGFTDSDMDRPIFINYVLGLESATLREIIAVCEHTYCSTIGVEFLHIQDPEQKAWIQQRIERIENRTDFTENGKRAIIERLSDAETFEKFLDKKFTGTKRFGLDGGEALVPALEQIVKRGGQLGVREIVIGMAHRGRLNILSNFMGKPYSAILAEFMGKQEETVGSGDVKYHLGTSSDRTFDGISVHLSLTANPSHLEVVDPVVIGKVRAKQRQLNDDDRTKVMGLLFHGDAAFAGQGVVSECFDMSQLKGYRTGGTMHIIINNQIGFTTSPKFSRSSAYCTDVAKQVDAPIFHVNADDPEAVVHCARIATEFRQEFKHDVVIDMICYRRFGHNEGDEPMFTQPLMYKKIKGHPTARTLYAQRLEAEGVLKEGEADAIYKRFESELESAFEVAQAYRPNKADWLEGTWSGLAMAEGDARRGDTAVSLDELKEIGRLITEAPQNFNLNSKIKRQLDTKRTMFETGQGIDWATAEALAFGTLLTESTPVRLSGQDSGRGTFSQRHAVLIDQQTEERYIPLNHLRFGQAPFEVIDSPLSEAGVLGFEYGYSLAEPHMLVLWEAQFGDFANGAQVIVDQFISSGETKWLRMCGLVMLLPHGYEGQGPEHSSARLERYLQLCAEDNIQVANCTTPANYFHILRRQMRRNFRKPLILMTPKSLLRHKLCVSPLSDFGPGSSFHRVLWDPKFDSDANSKSANDSKIKRVVLSQGKVFYDLYEEREKRGIDDIYLLRVEQLYPFPESALKQELTRFKDAEILWCQEEPYNMGAWHFVDRRLEMVMTAIGAKHQRPRYVGRAEAAATATGLLKRHIQEQRALVDAALTL